MRHLVIASALVLVAACGGGADEEELRRQQTSSVTTSSVRNSEVPPAPAPAATTTPQATATTTSFACQRGPTVNSTANPDNFDPCNPGASGYSLTFSDEFDSIATIDLDYSVQPASQKKWYFKSFWNGDQPAAKVSVQNGVLSLGYMPGVYGLQTAAPDGKGDYVGRAFGGGGYFEARLSFNPDAFGPGSEGIRIGGASWPAFWAMALEHGTFWKGTDQWPGQPKDYVRFIENDFFEYLAWGYGASPNANSYAAVLHDWYGIYNQTCRNGFCDGLDYGREPPFVNLPFNVNWREFNTIGQLWKPARNGQPGYALNFFNGQPVSMVTWYDERNDVPPPTARNRFSVMDRQKLYLILGTGPGSDIKVDYVRVWQQPSSANNATR